MRISQVQQERDANVFNLTVVGEKVSGRVCISSTIPFEQTVELEVDGLKAGTYEVAVNNVHWAEGSTFTLAEGSIPAPTPAPLEPTITARQTSVTPVPTISSDTLSSDTLPLPGGADPTAPAATLDYRVAARGCTWLHVAARGCTWLHVAARGYWEAVPQNREPVGKPGDIFYYDWYAIDTDLSDSATITWDNGHNCTWSPATWEGNEIRVTVGGVETVLVVHDATNAAVTFRQGDKTYTKQLQKKRDDPFVICM
jgi:hypothetical protein